MSPRATLVLLCLALPSVAGADEWWARDKALHLSVSLGLGGAAYGGLWLTGDDTPEARLALSFSLAMLPGLAKELYDDGQPGNRFSGKDMAWNAIGALVGSTLGYVIERLFHRHVGKRPTSGHWGLSSWARASCPGPVLPDQRTRCGRALPPRPAADDFLRTWIGVPPWHRCCFALHSGSAR